jgi:hypothetical protein
MQRAFGNLALTQLERIIRASVLSEHLAYLTVIVQLFCRSWTVPRSWDWQPRTAILFFRSAYGSEVEPISGGKGTPARAFSRHTRLIV